MRVYYNWDSPFPDRDLTWFNDNGYTLLLSVKSERRNHSFVQWRDIANAQPGRKAQWIADARALFKKPGWEGFKGVLYNNKTSKYPNCRWFVDSSQSSLAAFAGMANDVYYTLDEA
jgi:hypothetical protein